jgi:hypothetical protein
MQTDTSDQKFQYLPAEPEETTTGDQVKAAAGNAAAQVKEALPDGNQVRQVAGNAAAQVKEALPDGDQVKAAAGNAVAQVREVLPEPAEVKEVAGKAVAQVKAVLPDVEDVREEFIEVAHRLMEILPDGDDLRALLQGIVESVRNDPTIKAHIEAAADIVAVRVETTVGGGIDAVAGKAKTVVEKGGLEPLGYVATRIGEIAKEGVEELVEETKNKALH